MSATSRHQSPVVLPPARKPGRLTLGAARPFLFRHSAGSERVLFKAGALVAVAALVVSTPGWTLDRLIHCAAAVGLISGSAALVWAGWAWSGRRS